MWLKLGVCPEQFVSVQLKCHNLSCHTVIKETVFVNIEHSHHQKFQTPLVPKFRNNFVASSILFFQQMSYKRKGALLLHVYWNFAVHLCDKHPFRLYLPQMSCLMAKPTKWHGRPAKTRISLGGSKVFAVRWVGSQGLELSSCGQRKLIRLGGCPAWSESLLGAYAILLVLSLGGSNVLKYNTYTFFRVLLS